MGAASSVQAGFAGLKSQRQYGVCHAIDWTGVHTGTTTEKVFLFTGLSRADAFSTATYIVTDVGGTQYTVSFQDAISMSATNPPHVDASNAVTRTRTAPGLWDVEITNVVTTG